MSRHVNGFVTETTSSITSFQQMSRENHELLAESSTAGKHIVRVKALLLMLVAYQRAAAAFDGQKQALGKAARAMQQSQVTSQERFKSSETAIHQMSSTVLASVGLPTSATTSLTISARCIYIQA